MRGVPMGTTRADEDDVSAGSCQATYPASGEFQDQTVEQHSAPSDWTKTGCTPRIVVALAVVMNALFLLADWRVAGRHS